MGESIQKHEEEVQPQFIEGSVQKSATIYDFEEEKRRRNKDNIQESDIRKTENDKIKKIREDLKSNEQIDKKDAHYRHHFQNAIDVYQTGNLTTKKKAIKKFEKILTNAIRGGVPGQEIVMWYLICAGANNMILKSSLQFYKKQAEFWPEINFVLNTSKKELQKINNKYGSNKITNEFMKYYWTNIYDEKAKRDKKPKKIELIGRIFGR